MCVALLTDPNKESGLPDVLESNTTDGSIRYTIIEFNASATYAAIGTAEGKVCIWDILTKSVSTVLDEHVGPITALCWSSDSRSLLSTSRDFKAVIWNLEELQPKQTFCRNRPILGGAMHPLRPDQLLLLCESQPIVAIEGEGESSPFPDVLVSAVQYSAAGDTWLMGCENKVWWIETNTVSVLATLDISRAGWTRQVCFTPQNAGEVLVLFENKLVLWNMERARQAESGKLQSNGNPASSNHDKSGGKKEMNEEKSQSSNKDDDDDTVLVEFEDPVNKSSWWSITCNADYIVAANCNTASAVATVFDRNNGQLADAVLPFPTPLYHVALHPQRPLLLASSIDGSLLLASKDYVEQWSTFDPSFVELDANEVYEEREDEFDIISPEVVRKQKEAEMKKNELARKKQLERQSTTPVNCSSSLLTNSHSEAEKGPRFFMPLRPLKAEQAGASIGSLSSAGNKKTKVSSSNSGDEPRKVAKRS